LVAPYLLAYGSDALKKKYLPKMAAGEMISAIAMSEPGAGSDLQAIKTSASRKGNSFLLNGSKTFITNGWNCDLVIVVAKTDPAKGAKGTSLLVVDTSMQGFVKGKRLKKIGLKGQDTTELFFDNVEVPVENLLGQENNGFIWEFPISQAFVDARVTRIYGGTNEIMKEVISRSLGLGGKDG